jgi:hypothetical protein
MTEQEWPRCTEPHSTLGFSGGIVRRQSSCQSRSHTQ